jgi:hypothetical protein
MPAGLRPYNLAPINRGCVNKVVFDAVRVDDNCKETWIDKTNKRLFLTAKTKPWDNDADDSDAIFKIEGTIPDATNEPGRVVFQLSEKDTYQDPTIPYFCDIVETDSDGASNAQRLFIGTFNIIPGPNNEQAGGDN